MNKNKSTKPKVLNYNLLGVIQKKSPITLNLYEAEKYEPAVVVQQLIGNLVYYSNKGRYEPRIAENWKRINSHHWSFKIKKGFVCENGEEINPISFKSSLERTIWKMGKESPLPIFSKLSGYQKFIKEKNELKGIVANGDYLEFEFDDPLRSGLVEFLSFAPFGFICKENLNEDGSWKDDFKFISSGPYKVKEIKNNNNLFVLEKRKEWPSTTKNSPEIVNVYSDDKILAQKDVVGVIDSISKLDSPPSNFKNYSLVPEYLNLVLLGIEKGDFFENQINRDILFNTIQKVRSKFPNEWSNIVQTSIFYPEQEAFKEAKDIQSDDVLKTQARELLIEGSEPAEGTPRSFVWNILKGALDELGWKYKFKNNKYTMSELSNSKSDIRIFSPSVGGGFEAWGINMLFCSQFGTMMPDPKREICQALNDYENDKIEEKQLKKIFYDSIQLKRAVIPIARHGIQWYIGTGIKYDSISPLISIIRFDDLELE